MPVISPEMSAKLAQWRAKEAAGTLTQEDCKQIILYMRGERAMVPQATAGTKVRKTATKAAPKSGDDLLGELEGM